MKVPIKWLKEYIEIPDEKELIDKLTSVGHMQDGPAKEIEGDRVYDLEVRQNRSDCLSILGIAREAAAVLDKQIKDPTENLPEIPSLKRKTTVDIQDKNCFRFNTVTIEGVKVASSPKWLTEKLRSYGIKTINNIVDITNFVMVELGEPLHAWDAQDVKDYKIVIRKAKKGEKVTLLGGKVLSLTENDLVAADSEKVLTLAGIMGTEGSGVKESTIAIILEDATYNQALIRQSSLRHSVRTESSTRHEKFLHPHLTGIALKRATALILELSGGKVVDHTDAYPEKKERIAVSMSIERLNRLGGVSLNLSEVQKILERLQLKIKSSIDNKFTIEIPYFRTDLALEEDLIEEVLRIYGYDNIPPHLPSSPPPPPIDSQDFVLGEEIKNILLAAGYDEEVTEPLTKEENPTYEPVLLENSLNTDKTMLRTTLKNSLLGALSHQKKYRKSQIRLFELGKIYYKMSKSFEEQKMLGLLTYGIDYFELKGTLELLKERFESSPSFSDNSIEIIDENTYFVEIPLSTLKTSKTIKPYSEPPHVIFHDISFYAPIATEIGNLINDVKKASKLLRKVNLGEVPQVQNDQKTVLLKLEFYKERANLSKEEVEPEKEKIINLLTKVYDAKIR